MEKKFIILLVMFINIGYFCFAQEHQGPLKRAEALHAAYMTRELALTTTEAQSFWPIYRNYINEIRSTWRDNRKDQIALEEGILTIRKKYKPDFKKVLGSDERVNKMFIAEQTFKDMLKHELMNRRMKRQGIRQPT